MNALTKRIERLESLAAPETCYVARLDVWLATGKRVPSKPGMRLAPCVAVLPDVCETTEEWLAQVATKLR